MFPMKYFNLLCILLSASLTCSQKANFQVYPPLSMDNKISHVLCYVTWIRVTDERRESFSIYLPHHIHSRTVIPQTSVASNFGFSAVHVKKQYYLSTVSVLGTCSK